MNRSRRNPLVCLAVALTGLASLDTPELGAQGSLTPPGVPTPMGKTLTQIEPRIDVQRTVNPLPTDANYEYIIDQPGSYYLSANLAATKPNGILISASGVTLDLSGFEVSRASGTGGTGIFIASGVARCAVRNGTVTEFNDGVAVSSTNPIPRGGEYSHLLVSRGAGIGLLAGDGWQIIGCQAIEQQGVGIRGGDSVRARDCTASGNLGGGMDFGAFAVVESCIARGNTGPAGIQAGAGSSLTNCVAFANIVTNGIQASFGSVLRGCVARVNTSAAASSAGLLVSGESLVVDCVSTDNTNTNAVALASSGAGIVLGSDSEVRTCMVWRNKGDGIQVSSRAFVLENLCMDNGGTTVGAGIHATGSGSRIQSNHGNVNRRGIEVDGTENLILRNSAYNNSGNYDFAADNRYGPILNLTGANPNTINGDSATSTLTSTDTTGNYALD